MEDRPGALMEPLAVALHAVKRAGRVSGKKVLVRSGDPIGLLVMLTARAFGAIPVTLSDVVANRRATALNLGADAVLDPTEDRLQRQVREPTGYGIDVIFEASGAPSMFRQAFELVRPGGTLAQIGTLGTQDERIPTNQLIGSLRYGNVFAEAIRLVAAGRAGESGSFDQRSVPAEPTSPNPGSILRQR